MHDMVPTHAHKAVVLIIHLHEIVRMDIVQLTEGLSPFLLPEESKLFPGRMNNEKLLGLSHPHTF